MIILQDLITPQKAIRPYLERCRKDKNQLAPIAVEIHWTAMCNYNCMHCSYGYRRQGRQKIPLDLVTQLIDDLITLEVKAVYLSGGGEPTLYPKWWCFAEKLLLNNIDIALVTNGVLLDEHLETIRSFNYIAISVYSTDKNEYEKITGSRYFEKQFSLPEKIKSKPHRCIVGARCVINSVNYKSILDIYRMAIESGYDYIIFIPAIDYEGKGVCLGEEERNYLMELIQDNFYSIDERKTNLFNLKERKFNYYIEGDYRKDMYDFNKCLMLEIRSNAFINFDGKIYLCQPDIGNEDLAIGDLNQNRLLEIWNSAKHLRILEKLHERFKSGKCRYCRAIAFNRAIDRYLSPEPFMKDYFL